MTVKTNKKLIEVALPLDAINKASAREKSIRHGHPSTLHLWWARRPLAAARAVIFAQMVDDPSAYVDTLLGEPATKRAAQRELKKRLEVWEKRKAAFTAAKGDASVPEPGAKPALEDVAADIERERLFKIIEELVKWENTTNEEVLQRAREEIWQSWRRTCALNADHPRAKELFDRHKLPAFHDPFAGGGSLPLEAQRLGLEAYASDLNPVAVLINKAMIEIPPKFAGRPPVNPEARAKADLVGRQWKGAGGLAEDVRYYGKWMRDEAEKRIGHLYPTVQITAAMATDRPDLEPYVGRSLKIIAWLWARTVKSPNPAFKDVDVPLASTFVLAPMQDREAFVVPVVGKRSYKFVVRTGSDGLAQASSGSKVGRGAAFRCVMSGTPIDADYIKNEGLQGGIGSRMMAMIAEGDRERVYLSPMPMFEEGANAAVPSWKPETHLEGKSADQLPLYGFTEYWQLFTHRQLVTLSTMAQLVREVVDSVACEPGSSREHALAIGIYLGLAVSRFADRNNSLCTWDSGPTGTKTATGGSARTASVTNLFKRQAVAMSWDFAEANPFSASGGSFESALDWIVPAIRNLPATTPGRACARDAAEQTISLNKVISTDPPYFDNIAYADLSDFFYVWLRHTLRELLPDDFATVAVPKSRELVATPYRHPSKDDAEAFFLTGMTSALSLLSQQAHPAQPLTIYYAFKQSEIDGATTTSTGWERFLDSFIRAGLSLTGTWPIRTELTAALKKRVGALASSIVLVGRPRSPEARIETLRNFLNALKEELPQALVSLQRSNIAPVDLAQAAIGPGMAVFTRFVKVIDAQGAALSVRQALAFINEVLDEVLAQQEGDFDPDTRWALTWFEQTGFAEGEYGTAEQLSKSKNTSVGGMAEAGILHSGRGKVRLLKPSELPKNWDPATDMRLTVWEIVHHLIRVLEAHDEVGAGKLVAKLGTKAEIARELAYRLFTICERRKRAAEALSYDALVRSWPEITRLAQNVAPTEVAQGDLLNRA